MAMLFGAPSVGAPIPLFPPVTTSQPVVAQPIVAQPVVAQPQPSYVSAPANGQAQCFPVAPRLETVLLRSGGTALVCTRGDGTLSGWRSPLFTPGAIGAALTPGMMQGATLGTALAAPQMAYAAPRTANAIPTPPRGYRLAWTDDRLNPARGLGTAAGQAQQDQVWTRTVPAYDVNAQPARKGVARLFAATPAPRTPAYNTTVSTMSAPAVASHGLVQVGTYGQPSNAAGAKARLAALGLPVSTSQITRKGKVLQIVFAGPFATPAEAQSALATTRSAGFTDAILK